MENQSFKHRVKRSISFSTPLTLLFAMLSLVLITACGDDEPTIEEQSPLGFLNENVQISDGTIFDYGPVNYVDFGDPTHYNYDFLIHDGSFDNDDESFQGSFLMVAELLSPGTEQFRAGSFSYIFPETISQVEGDFYFNAIVVFVDGNGNNSLFVTSADEREDLLYIGTDGTVDVVDNGDDNYTLRYNLTMSQADYTTEDLIEGTATTVEFSVSSDFEIVDTSFFGRQSDHQFLIDKK